MGCCTSIINVHVYDTVPKSGSSLACFGKPQLFAVPLQRPAALTLEETSYGGRQFWELHALTRNELKGVVKRIKWGVEDAHPRNRPTSHGLGRVDPLAIIARQDAIEDLRRERRERMVEVEGLLNTPPGYPVKAARLSVKTLPSGNPIQARLVPGTEAVIKNAADFMDRVKLWELIHDVNGQDHAGFSHPVERVVELLKNGSCIYGQFTRCYIGQEKFTAQNIVKSSMWCCGTPPNDADDSSFVDLGGASDGEATDMVVGVQIGTGTWKIKGSDDDGLYTRKFVLTLNTMYKFESNSADDVVTKPEWVEMASEEEGGKGPVKVELDEMLFGDMGYNWKRWLTIDGVIAAQSWHRSVQDRMERGPKPGDGDSEDLSITDEDGGGGASKEEKKKGKAGGKKMKQDGSWINMYMEVTMGNLEAVRNVVAQIQETFDASTTKEAQQQAIVQLVTQKYEWDGTLNTAIHQAARYGTADIMEYLVTIKGLKQAELNQKNGRPNETDPALLKRYQKTPLHMVSANLHLETAKYLVDGLRGPKLDPDTEKQIFIRCLKTLDGEGRTALRIVLEQQQEAEAREMRERCREFVWVLNELLHWQQRLVRNIEFGDEAGCLQCIDNGAQPDGIGDPFKPTNYYSAEFGDSVPSFAPRPLHKAAALGHASIIKLLRGAIKQKTPDRVFAAVNAKDYDGATPLHLAARFGSEECTTVLLATGAIVNAKDRQERTALHYCSANLTAFSCEVAEILLSYRIDVWAEATSGDGDQNTHLVTALDFLPDAASSSEKGKTIWAERESLMDLLRAHMGMPDIDAIPPPEMHAGTHVEVRLPLGLGQTGKGPWHPAVVTKVQQRGDQSEVHLYDVRLMSGGEYLDIDSDIRLAEFDMDAIPTYSSAFHSSTVAPDGEHMMHHHGTGADPLVPSKKVDDMVHKEWHPVTVKKISANRRSGQVFYSVLFVDESVRMVLRHELKRAPPPKLSQVLDPTYFQEPQSDRFKPYQVGDRAFVRGARATLKLQCLYHGCGFSIRTPPMHINEIFYRQQRRRLRQHQLDHLTGGGGKVERGMNSPGRNDSQITVSFQLIVMQANRLQDGGAMRKDARTLNTYCVVRCADYETPGTPMSTKHRYQTNVVRNDDAPVWDEIFNVMEAPSERLHLQIEVYNQRRDEADNKCLGHCIVSLSAKISIPVAPSKVKKMQKDYKYVPRFGRGSHLLDSTDQILLPMVATCKLYKGSVHDNGLNAKKTQLKSRGEYGADEKFDVGTISFKLCGVG